MTVAKVKEYVLVETPAYLFKGALAPSSRKKSESRCRLLFGDGVAVFQTSITTRSKSNSEKSKTCFEVSIPALGCDHAPLTFFFPGVFYCRRSVLNASTVFKINVGKGSRMPRPVTLFTGQWADLKLEELCKKAKDFGYDGLELACWGDHFEVDKALSDDTYCARKRDLLGTARPAAVRHFQSSRRPGGAGQHRRSATKSILPEYVWGDGKPEGVNERAIEEMKNTARAAQKAGRGRRQRLHRVEHLAPDLRFPADAARR